LAGKTLDELTKILVDLKNRNHSNMHNRTDVDSPQRAIRAIEIETYNLKTPLADRYVPPVDSLVIGVDISREERRKRISQRLKDRLDGGMVEEVRRLVEEGIPPENLIYYGLEYRYVTEYVIGKISYDEMFSQLEIAIHQFAKRQMTWFRGMEKRGTEIHWVDASLPVDQKVALILDLWK
jgi:tRNA dimethylallyltransferase